MPDWRADFKQFHETIQENYAYWPSAPCSWAKIPAAYEAEIAAVKTRDDFVRLLEQAIGELCDAHASLGTNLASSYRLVPSGTELWVEARDSRVLLTDIRTASETGLQTGLMLERVGDKPLAEALLASWPRTVPQNNQAATTYIANMLVAGRHDQPRSLTFSRQTVTLKAAHVASQPPVARVLPGNIGYVCIPNSLGENATIAGFDAAMEKVRDTKGLVLDLRLTPSGGNTTVARAILSWFVEREREYQRHDDPSEERVFGIRRFWTEWVAPRPGKSYKKPVCVLVNRWTGSMGEGIAIALQGMHRAKLVGGPMAGLQGAITRFTLDSSGIAYFFPTERLFRLDGTPRERCLPDIHVPYAPQDSPLHRATTLLTTGK